MRDRHFPRLCRSCNGPMARQEDSCWRCEAPAAGPAPRPALTAAAATVRWTDDDGDIAAAAAG
jgi:hypothetical protein